MMFAAGIGILSAIVLLIVMARLGIRKFMGYPAVLDVVVTLTLAWLLHGTYVGMTAAIIGGLFFSLMITIIRKTLGYQRLTTRGWVSSQGDWTAAVLSKLTLIPSEGITQCLNLKSSKLWACCMVFLLILLSVQ